MSDTPAYPKRLIEIDLPIKRISAQARREKSIRHGHISTLHIWWARRPLASCRAVILAALWPDPADPMCPPRFLEEARESLEATLGGQTTVNIPKRDYADPKNVRTGLLDFIAEFANWDNSTNKDYLRISRHLVQVAHESLGGAAGTQPIVLDPFAGGGSIPLEAMRVGADAIASDLNPVAVLINKVTLEYIPKFGQRLADDVRKWGAWVKNKAEVELSEFYPKGQNGEATIAYLWSRTIISEAPAQGDVPVEVPLIRSMWLAKRAGRNRALRWSRNSQGEVICDTLEVKYADGITRRVRRPLMEIIEPKSENEVERGTSARGSATCPVSGFTTPVSSVRNQLTSRRGGTSDARMLAVIQSKTGSDGRLYRIPSERDLEAVKRAETELARRSIEHRGPVALIPDEKILLNEIRRISVPLYGMTKWSDLFTPRQSVSLATLAQSFGELETWLRNTENRQDLDILEACLTCLQFAFDRCLDKMAAQVVWHTSREFVDHVFAKQALPIVWVFAEADFFADIGWQGACEWVAKVIEENSKALLCGGHVDQASADRLSLPNDSVNAFITDPPYYYSVPYSNLSDYFYVWIKRGIFRLHPALLAGELTPKDDECVQNLPHSEVDPIG